MEEVKYDIPEDMIYLLKLFNLESPANKSQASK